MEIEHKLNVVTNSIYGEQEEGKNLYLIVWERLANNGFIYCWAKDEIEALALFGYNEDYVKHTIVKIDKNNMPVEVGIKG